MQTQLNDSQVAAYPSRHSALLVDGLKVFGFAALLALSAQVRFYPPGSAIPVTLQTAAALLCGFWLRPRLAVAAVALYLVAGFAMAQASASVSLFAAFAVGRTVTLGYLVGFLPAAGLVSLLTGSLHKLTLGRALAVATAGTIVLFLFGAGWQAMLLGSAEKAFMTGVVPFVGWAAVKIAVVAALVSACGMRR